MRILKNKQFHHWAKEEGVSDAALLEAIEEMKSKLYDANLGGNIYKKRIAVGNRGKSGGVRTIVAFKGEAGAFFIYGFAKNQRENITKKEENILKELAKVYFSYDKQHIEQAVKAGVFIEVTS